MFVCTVVYSTLVFICGVVVLVLPLHSDKVRVNFNMRQQDNRLYISLEYPEIVPKGFWSHPFYIAGVIFPK